MEKETNQQMDELTRQYELLKKETDRLTIKNKRQIEDIMHTKTNLTITYLRNNAIRYYLFMGILCILFINPMFSSSLWGYIFIGIWMLSGILLETVLSNAFEKETRSDTSLDEHILHYSKIDQKHFIYYILENFLFLLWTFYIVIQACNNIDENNTSQTIIFFIMVTIAIPTFTIVAIFNYKKRKTQYAKLICDIHETTLSKSGMTITQISIFGTIVMLLHAVIILLKHFHSPGATLFMINVFLISIAFTVCFCRFLIRSTSINKTTIILGSCTLSLIFASLTHLINHWGGIKTITILTIMFAVITIIQYIIHKKKKHRLF